MPTLPQTFKSTEPQASEQVSTGPAVLQANFAALGAFLGIPDNIVLTASAFQITSAGIVTIAQGGATVVADPTTPLGIATKQYVDSKTGGSSSGALFAGIATNVGNAYSVTLTPPPASQAVLANTVIIARMPVANTGAATLNVQGFGALNIVKDGTLALNSGDIAAQMWAVFVYDVTNGNYQLENPVVPASGGFLSVNLNSPVTLAPSATTTILTLTVTAPSSGGPFRLFASYFAYFTLSASNGGIEMQVTDGTNKWSFSASGISGPLTAQGLNANDYSPVTYANGATVTLTLQGRITGSGPGPVVATTSASGLAMPTNLKALFVAAN